MELNWNAPLQLQDISIGYDRNEVLSQLTMHLEPGRIHAILGENGSGKSTLLKALLGQLPLWHGSIKLGNTDLDTLTNKERAQSFSYVPQFHGGLFHYPVLEMVVMGRNPYLGMLQRPSTEDYNMARETLHILGISHIAQESYLQLSGGQKQLVLLARALTQDSPYLLLDEPTSHLDYYYQHHVLQCLRKLAIAQKKTIIITMHDPNLTSQYADEVHILKQGSLLASGSSEVVLTKENLSALYGLEVNICEFCNGVSPPLN